MEEFDGSFFKKFFDKKSLCAFRAKGPHYIFWLTFYILSGIPIPRSANAFLSVCSVAFVNAKRKFFVFSSSAASILQSK